MRECIAGMDVDAWLDHEVDSLAVSSQLDDAVWSSRVVHHVPVFVCHDGVAARPGRCRRPNASSHC